MLFSCGEAPASSSSSVASSSSEPLPCVTLTGGGDMSFSLDVAIEGESSNVSRSFVGMEFAIQDDYPSEKRSDRCDDTYYAEANMIGDLSC